MLGRIHRGAGVALAVGAIASGVPTAVVFADPSGGHGGQSGDHGQFGDHGEGLVVTDRVREIMGGPSGNSIDDLFTPEIDSIALEASGNPYPGEISWTEDGSGCLDAGSYVVNYTPQGYAYR